MIAEAQLPLAFEHRPALTDDDFLVGDCNRDAVAWLDKWPQWPAPALIIYGDPGCGKSHLARAFMSRCGAPLIDADDLLRGEPNKLLGHSRAVVMEMLDKILTTELEEPLLHLYNTLRETKRHLVITAHRPAARWNIMLPDLLSRLNAAPAVRIGEPDDALIGAVIGKLFLDRQLQVDQDVIPYMLARMERSFDMARLLVAAIDRAALANRRNITVPLVGSVMQSYGEQQ